MSFRPCADWVISSRRPAMPLNSLALRLFFSATTWTVLILVVTGIVLSSLYRAAVERAFDRRLGVYLRTLVADVATPQENADKFPQSLGEPLFELPLSGWYWQVTRLDLPHPDVRASRSLWDGRLPRLADLGVSLSPAGTRQGYAEGPEGQELRVVERTIDLGEEGRYLVAVAGEAAEIDEETRSFGGTLLLTFGVLGAVLLLMITFQVRFGLAPLNRVSEGLAAIRSGDGRTAGRRLPGRDRAAGARDQRADRRQPRDRDARPHSCRKPRARPQDADLGDAERGRRSRRRPVGRQGARADRDHARPGRPPARARAARGPRFGDRHHYRRAPGGVGARPHDGEDPSQPRGRHRDRRARRRPLPRRAAGPRGDGGQPRRQRLQMGAVAGGDRGVLRPDRYGRRAPDGAHPGRRRRAGAFAATAGAGRRAAAAASTRPSRAPGWASRSSSSSPAFMAASSRSAPRRSEGCGRSWCCPGRRHGINPVGTEFRPSFSP